MLHLQFYDDVSDSEAWERTQYSGYGLVQQSI